MNIEELYAGMMSHNRFMVFDKYNRYWKEAMRLYKRDNPNACHCGCSKCRKPVWEHVMALHAEFVGGKMLSFK